jgi:hypothetical protein
MVSTSYVECSSLSTVEVREIESQSSECSSPDVMAGDTKAKRK